MQTQRPPRRKDWPPYKSPVLFCPTCEGTLCAVVTADVAVKEDYVECEAVVSEDTRHDVLKLENIDLHDADWRCENGCPLPDELIDKLKGLFELDLEYNIVAIATQT